VRGAVAGEPVITGRAVGPNSRKKGSTPAEDPPLFEAARFRIAAATRGREGPQKQVSKAEAPPAQASAPPPKPTPSRFTPRSESKPEPGEARPDPGP